MRNFILFFLLVLSLPGLGQKLEKPIELNSFHSYLFDLDFLSPNPYLSSKVSSTSQIRINFDGENLIQQTLVPGQTLEDFKYSISSYQVKHDSDDPNLEYWILHAKDSADILTITIDKKEKKAFFKNISIDDYGNPFLMSIEECIIL